MRASPLRRRHRMAQERGDRLASSHRALPDLLRCGCGRTARRCNRYPAADNDHVWTQVHESDLFLALLPTAPTLPCAPSTSGWPTEASRTKSRPPPSSASWSCSPTPCSATTGSGSPRSRPTPEYRMAPATLSSRRPEVQPKSGHLGYGAERTLWIPSDNPQEIS